MGEGWFPRPRRGGEGQGEGPRGISSSRLRFKLKAATPHLNPLPSEGRGRSMTGLMQEKFRKNANEGTGTGYL